jgi:alcohol dehydrogenase, propanol-preferring
MKAARLHAYGEPLVLEEVPFEITFEATLWSTIRELREVVSLAERGMLGPIELETAPLEKVNEVYRRLKNGEVHGRAVITP